MEARRPPEITTGPEDHGAEVAYPTVHTPGGRGGAGQVPLGARWPRNWVRPGSYGHFLV